MGHAPPVRSQWAIGLWRDRCDDDTDPMAKWAVSVDDLDAKGLAKSTISIKLFPASKPDEARRYAIELSKELALPVIETKLSPLRYVRIT